MPIPKRLIWTVTGSEENRSMLAIDSQIDSLSDITLGAFEAIRIYMVVYMQITVCPTDQHTHA